MMVQGEQWGLIGLGLLGSALAERLLHQGATVCGFDLEPSAASELTKRGGQRATSVQEVVANQRLISLCLPDGQVVKEVVTDPGNAWVAGTVVLDHSTISPAESVALAQWLAQRGVTYLEATIAGSSQKARDGQALMLVAGDDATFQRMHRHLRELSPQVYYLGASGSAARMKLLFNHLLGLHRAVLAETLGLAMRQQMNVEQVLEILAAAAPLLDVTRTKGSRMLERNYEPQARLSQHRKDVGLILQDADRCDAFLPFQQLHAQLLDQAIEQGWGDADNSAVFELFRP